MQIVPYSLNHHNIYPYYLSYKKFLAKAAFHSGEIVDLMYRDEDYLLKSHKSTKDLYDNDNEEKYMREENCRNMDESFFLFFSQLFLASHHSYSPHSFPFSSCIVRWV